MIIFKTNKQKHLAQELKSWIRSIVLISLIFTVFYFLGKLNTDKVLLGLLIVFLLKLADTFTQYHVHEIKVDQSNNKFDVLLKSLMTGKKTKSYELSQLNASIVEHSGIKRILFDKTTLQISLPKNQTFYITERYGFSKESLKEIEESIQQNHSS